MADLYAKVRDAARLLKEISDEVGYSVHLVHRRADDLIPEDRQTVMIEGDLPCGYVHGSGITADKALGEALARLADVQPMSKAA